MSDITDETSTKTGGAEAAKPSTFDRNVRDGSLTEMVYFINCMKDDLPGGMPITLFVGGIIVTGELIPAWRWFEEQARGDDEVDPLFGRWAKQAKDQRDADADADRPMDPAELPSYINLKHATFLAPPAKIKADFYWRGRISRVDGWVLGRLDIGDQP